ncbi:dynamin family protein [Senimuribacter intestinalis]|uniref:dynamin family protein n=1 Tax=Senimuribacter intestinalis TaxID=2941507 RepID=UPI002042055D|nr:dynamin family protein [Senimuribacter intestinalis]
MSGKILEQSQNVYELLAADGACSGQAKEVRALIDKLEKRDMTVSIIGQFKRGKSSLSNAILGAEILPVGIVPITSAVTRVVYGDKGCEVHFQNGVVTPIEFEELSAFISEQENADNRLGVDSVILRTPSEFLKDGLTFVDTPGVGSFHKNNTETAYHYMKESDAVIFLLSVDSPINQIEIDFLQSTKEFAGKFYFAVNKIDVVGEADLQAYVQYCQKLLCQLMGVDSVAMFPVSAKTGAGVEELKTSITEDCLKNAGEILEESAAKKLKDLISRTLNQLDFYWKAMNMEYKELDDCFEQIHETVQACRTKAAAAESFYELHLNEIKLQLSAKVLELFGMEYQYEIEELPAGLVAMSKDDFLREVDTLCNDLNTTLSDILLYREENAYAVVRRINAINRLGRSLRRIREKL